VPVPQGKGTEGPRLFPARPLRSYLRIIRRSSTQASSSSSTLVTPRDVIRAQHELALKAASFETAVRLGNLIQ